MKPLNHSTVFAAFDIESTGLHPVQDRVIELAAVKFTIEGQVLDEFSSLIHPGMPIPEASTRVHRIRDEDVVDAPRAAAVLHEFREFLGEDTILVAHNSEFDCHFLGAEYLLEAIDLPPNAIWDSLELSRSFVKGIMNHKLETLVHHYALAAGEFHRALDDSRYLMRLMQRFYADGFELKSMQSKTTVRKFEDARQLFSVSLPLSMAVLNKAVKKGLKLSFEHETAGQKEAVEATPSFLYRTEKFEWLQGIDSIGERQDWRLDRISRPKLVS